MIHQCTYCMRNFVRETMFKKHYCDEHKRFDLLRTPTGIKAFGSYVTWLKCKGAAGAKPERFLDSRYFTSMIKFEEFVVRVGLPMKERYIQYMNTLGILPADWSATIVYDKYIEKYEELVTINEQFFVALETVDRLSRIYDCAPGKIFNYMDAPTCIRLMQAKCLSPWLLLNSGKFSDFMLSQFSSHDKITFGAMVSSDIWYRKFKKVPKKVQTFKRQLVELDL